MDVKIGFLKKNLLVLFLSGVFFCSSSFYTLTDKQNLSALLDKSHEPQRNLDNEDLEKYPHTISALSENKPHTEAIELYSNTPNTVSNSDQTSLRNDNNDNNDNTDVLRSPTSANADNTSETIEINKTEMQNTPLEVHPTASTADKAIDITATPIHNNFSETNLHQEIFLEDVSVAAENLTPAITSHSATKIERVEKIERIEEHSSSPISDINEITITMSEPKQTELSFQNDLSSDARDPVPQSPTTLPIAAAVSSVSEKTHESISHERVVNEPASSGTNVFSIQNHALLLKDAEGESNKVSLLNLYHKLNANENFSPFLEEINAGVNATAVIKPATFNLIKPYSPTPARITLAKNQSKNFYYKIGGARIQWATWSAD